jgi:hypothetical protein
MTRCTYDTHVCEALALAFFALWHTGALDDATRAAVARCHATPRPPAAQQFQDGRE